MSLSLILPAYNEGKNIAATVRKCVSYCNEQGFDYEIIVVNDGSTDRTQEVIEELMQEIPQLRLLSHPENRGYGSALRTGFDDARKEDIFYMDSDGQFTIEDLGFLLEQKEPDAIMIGYRAQRADSPIRALNAWLYRKYLRIVFGLQVRDVDCAFKLFPTKAYRDVRPIKSNGAFFSAELLLAFKKQGWRLKEVPVRHFSRRLGSQTGAKIKVIMKMFQESWTYWRS